MQIHQAKSSKDTHSLHLTVSTALRNTWSDLFELLVPRALEIATQSDIEFRRSLPMDMREYMGVMNAPDEGSDGSGDEDESASPARTATAQARQREFFMGKIQVLFASLASPKQLPVDAAVDQFLRRNLHARMPPVFPQVRPAAYGRPTADTVVRLLRHDLAHIAVEKIDTVDRIVLYHAAGNTCRYKETSEGARSFDLGVAPALEHLIRAYPSWTPVHEIPAEDEHSKLAVESAVEELLQVGVLVAMQLGSR
eukprot:SAG11_NODE_1064_length_5994_cov_4.748601_3_plen_253_part_00